MTPSFTAVDALAEERAVVLIPTDRLRPHPHNPRRDVGDISDLTADVAARGIDSPLTVVDDGVPEPGFDYLVVIGHRRHAAALAAGLPRVPCIVRDLTPAEQLAMMLRENVHRSDLTVVEEADAIQGLLDLGLTVDEVARDVARSESTVRRRMRLAAAPEPARAAIHGGQATLEQWDQVLKTADGDDELVDRLAAVMGTRDFDYQVRSAVVEKGAVAARAAALSWLAERGIPVVHHREYDRATHRTFGNVDGYKILKGDPEPSIEGRTGLLAHSYAEQDPTDSTWFYLLAEVPEDERREPAEETQRRGDEQVEAAEREAEAARQRVIAERDAATAEHATARDCRTAFVQGMVARGLNPKQTAAVLHHAAVVLATAAIDGGFLDYEDIEATLSLDVDIDAAVDARRQELIAQAQAEGADDPEAYADSAGDDVDAADVAAAAVPARVAELPPGAALLLLAARAGELPISVHTWWSRALAGVPTRYYAMLEDLGYEPSTPELVALGREAGTP